MSLPELNTFDTGDTAYVAKHNANVALLQNWIETLFDKTNSQALNNATVATDAMFGDAAAFIGWDSYSCIIKVGDSTKLQVGAGFAYRYSRHQAVVNTVATTELDFTGQTAGTYYVRGSIGGSPEYVDDSTDALWSVSWSGTALSALTRVARTVWGADDWIAAQTSAKFAATYHTLNDRLDAIEEHFAADFGFQLLGVVPTGGQMLLRFVALRPMSIPASFVGSCLRLEVAPSDDDWVVTVRHIPDGGVGSDVGTITVAMGDTEASTYALSGGLDLDAKDEFHLIAPAVADSTASGPYGTFWASR